MSTAPVSAASVPGPVIQNAKIIAPVVFRPSLPHQTAFYSKRLCTVCALAIPLARLKAVPNATKCVECLEAGGDVDKIKSLDGGVELSSLYTKSDSYIEAHERHLRHALVNAPGVTGDDAHLDKTIQPIAGYKAADAFEDSMIHCIDLKKQRGDF
jgi:hypothetical protein